MKGPGIEAPCILDENEDFAVLCKPPRMHCAPQKQSAESAGDTLLEWYARVYPPIMELKGRREGEGGLLHRLDFETRGLVLFAKNQSSLDSLLRQQEEGIFVKEYSALASRMAGPLPGFPPCDVLTLPSSDMPGAPFSIESFFRPYGPGRKSVRPVNEAGQDTASDRGKPYRTEVISFEKKSPALRRPSASQRYLGPEFVRFTLSLKRGFRHQIRCHLAWTGFSILNDPVYGGAESPESAEGFLALSAAGLFFEDPRNKIPREYRIHPLEIP